MGINDTATGISATTCALVMAATMAGSAVTAAADDRAIEFVEGYCSTSWKNARIDQQDWADCTQETFTRLLERVNQDNWINAVDAKSDERRELSRSIWCTVQKWKRQPRSKYLNTETVTDRETRSERTPAQILNDIRELLARHKSDLSPRQFKIISRWVDGVSVHDIANQLGIPASRVSDEKYKAIRKLRRHIA